MVLLQISMIFHEDLPRIAEAVVKSVEAKTPLEYLQIY